MLVVALGARSRAGTVTVKVEPPPAPPLPALKAKGWLDRTENPWAPPRGMPVTPYLAVVLEGDAATTATPPQITWELVGESFGRPILVVPVGAEIVIKNVSKTARSLAAVEDGKLLPPGPLNPTGLKSFRVTEARTYTIADKDAPHLRGTVIVVASPFIGHFDTSNKTEIENVPEGSYKARIFYRDGWVAEKPVTVAAKGKVEVAFEKGAIPAGGASGAQKK